MTPNLIPTLEYILASKEDIRLAITSKGGNLDGVPFEQWGSVIAGLQFGEPTHPAPVETTTAVEDVVQVGSDVAAAVPPAGYPVPQVPDMVPAGMGITSTSAWYWPFDFTGESVDSGIPAPIPISYGPIHTMDCPKNQYARTKIVEETLSGSSLYSNGDGFKYLAVSLNAGWV